MNLSITDHIKNPKLERVGVTAEEMSEGISTQDKAGVKRWMLKLEREKGVGANNG